MKTCPVCQKFVTDQAKFCYYCGASLLNVTPDAPAPEVEQKPVEEIVAPVADAVEEPVEKAMEEPAETVEEPVAEAIEEPVEKAAEEVVDAPVEAVEEPAVFEEPVAVEEPAAVEEPVTVEEPAEVQEPIAVEEPVAVEEPITVEEPAAVEEPAPAEPVKAPVAAAVETPVPPVAAPVQPVVNATDSRSLMTTAGYIFTTILFHIPIVGLIFMIVWGCGKPKNISRKRFSLAMLILRLLGVICFLLIAVFMLIVFSERIPAGWYHNLIG